MFKAMAPMMPVLFPILLPGMMPKVLPHLIRLVESTIVAWLRRGTSSAGGGPAWEGFGIDRALARIWARPLALSHALGLHVVAWMVGAIEIWVALRWMGKPVDPGGAIILESLGQALRSAAFLVPSAVGVQEASFIALGQFLGLGAESMLALSLVTTLAALRHEPQTGENRRVIARYSAELRGSTES